MQALRRLGFGVRCLCLLSFPGTYLGIRLVYFGWSECNLPLPPPAVCTRRSEHADAVEGRQRENNFILTLCFPASSVIRVACQCLSASGGVCVPRCTTGLLN